MSDGLIPPESPAAATVGAGSPFVVCDACGLGVHVDGRGHDCRPVGGPVAAPGRGSDPKRGCPRRRLREPRAGKRQQDGRTATGPCIVAEEPGCYDLPDFSALGDGPYPPILLEAFELAGNGFRRWDEQVARTGYCCRPIRLKGTVEQVDRATGEVRRVYTTEGNPTTRCWSRVGAVGPRCAGRARRGTSGTPSTSCGQGSRVARGCPSRWWSTRSSS